MHLHLVTGARYSHGGFPEILQGLEVLEVYRAVEQKTVLAYRVALYESNQLSFAVLHSRLTALGQIACYKHMQCGL